MKMKKEKIIFSSLGALLIIIFLITINAIVNPDNKWSVYPCLVVVFWPIIIYHVATKKYKALALVSSLSLVFFLGMINYVASPMHPWFLYAAYPILWWPIFMYAGRWGRKVSFAVVSSFSFIVYYVVLNLILSPQFPWSFITAFVFLWWPIIHYFVKTKKHMLFSIVGSGLTSVFFITLNYTTTPNTIWAIYPVFAVLWWPLIVYCFKTTRNA